MATTNMFVGPDLESNHETRHMVKQMCLQLARCEPLHDPHGDSWSQVQKPAVVAFVLVMQCVVP